MKIIILMALVILIIFMSSCKPTIPIIDDVIEDEQEDGMYMVSHSEYWSGEEGQIVARLLNWQGAAISANCSVDVLYPNKTYFIQNQTMGFSIDSYYHNFTTPSLEGVYEYKASCEYGSKSRSVLNSFHVSPALNFIQISYDNLTGQLIDLTDLNNAHFGNLSYNLTQIKDDTTYIRANFITNASMVSYQNNVLSKLDNISAFCGTNYTSSSLLCLWVNETRLKLTSMNASIDNYLFIINQTTDTSAGIIITINETVANISGFTEQDRFMLEKVYNCTIFGEGCHLTPELIWNYSGKYINGEVN